MRVSGAAGGGNRRPPRGRDGDPLARANRKHPTRPPPFETFLHGWTSHTFDPSVQFVDTKGTPIDNNDGGGPDHQADRRFLAHANPTFKPAKPRVTGATATDTIAVSWPITATARWTYQTSMTMKLVDDGVKDSPSRGRSCGRRRWSNHT